MTEPIFTETGKWLTLQWSVYTYAAHVRRCLEAGGEPKDYAEVSLRALRKQLPAVAERVDELIANPPDELEARDIRPGAQ